MVCVSRYVYRKFRAFTGRQYLYRLRFGFWIARNARAELELVLNQHNFRKRLCGRWRVDMMSACKWDWIYRFFKFSINPTRTSFQNSSSILILLYYGGGGDGGGNWFQSHGLRAKVKSRDVSVTRGGDTLCDLLLSTALSRLFSISRISSTYQNT